MSYSGTCKIKFHRYCCELIQITLHRNWLENSFYKDFLVVHNRSIDMFVNFDMNSVNNL